MLSGDLARNPWLPQPRRMQQHIEPAERFGRFGHHVLDGQGVADVALHPGDAGPIGWRGLVICRDDGGSRLAQHLDRNRADAGRAARDEDPPALQ